MRGTASDGRPYRASDPHLLRWVHVAEIWSFFTAHQRFGAAPLTPAEADEYVAQTNGAARLLGATDLPETIGELDEVIAAYRPELRSTAEARDACDFLLHEPPLPAGARAGYGLLAQGAVHLLPDWARTELGVPEPRFARAGGLVGTRAVRWGMGAFG